MMVGVVGVWVLYVFMAVRLGHREICIINIFFPNFAQHASTAI